MKAVVARLLKGVTKPMKLLVIAILVSCVSFAQPISSEPQSVETTLIDGSHFRGTLLTDSIPIQTTYARLILEVRFISRIEFKHDGQATIRMANGDLMQGTIGIDSLMIETLLDKMEVALRLIRTVHFISQVRMPTEGPVAYYPLDGNADDVSGNDNDGSMHNTVATLDRFGNAGKALQFDGVSSYIQIPDDGSLRFESGISVCAWVKPQELYRGRCQGNVIVSKGGDDVAGWYGLLYQDDEDCGSFDLSLPHFKFGIRFDDERANVTSNAFSLGKTHCVVGTYDGVTMRLYVNGKLENTTTIHKKLSTNNSGDVTIGRLMSQKYPYWVTGILDDISIYNRPLTEAEISILWEQRATE